MGIRFLCDTCQKKINVKDFLAGKRGVCPHCGASVAIPMESTLPSKSKRHSNQEAEPEVAPTEALPTPQAAAVGTPVPSTPAAAATASPSPAVPTGVPVGTAAPTTSAEPAAGVPVGSPVGASPAVPVGAPVSQSAPTATPQAALVGAPAQPVGSPPPPANANDPIAEAPNANWYVRPPSGGQYGPAKGDVMRKWIGEGRVTPDSLIWRDGWADWQTAGPLFPELTGGVGPAAGAGPDLSVGTSTTSTTNKTRPPARRKKSNSSLAIVIVVVLVLISIALIGILLAVLLPPGDEEDETSMLPTPVRSTPAVIVSQLSSRQRIINVPIG